MLDKPEFDCTNLGDFYDCGCEDEGEKKKEEEEGSAASQKESSGGQQHEGLAVEISREA